MSVLGGSSALRLAIGCFFGVTVVVAAIASRFLPGFGIGQIEATLRQIQGFGGLGLLIFAAIQMLVAVVGLLPASLIGIAAGAIYGAAVGFTVSALSTMLGALIAFSLSRSLLRPFIAQVLQNRTRLQNLDTVMARDGWRIVLLLRLSPIMPFAATSYALGLSSISLQDYCIGSLAALPALLGYVILGSLTTAGLSALSQGSGPLQWTLLGLGIVATALITWRIGKLAMMAGLGPTAHAGRPE
jgi:uncharacterized membrane protein YdjX (TVP38/TMEM64 family)